MKYYPCAKINLGLNVVERRADGYHNLETVFFPVAVNDELEVEILDDSCSSDTAETPYCQLVVTGVSELCEAQRNLVYKAYMLLAEDYDLPPVAVRLHKGVPSQAGMGGGSSDGAYMIRLLNDSLSLGMTVEQMRGYAARLGADCAFFITSDCNNPQPLYATGIGDELQEMPETWNTLKGKWIALVKPDVAVSTKEAYAGITPRKPQKNCREILMQPLETWRGELVNDFEESIFPKLPVLAEVKQAMYDHGAVYAAMSGSGSTVFGIFHDKPTFPEEEGTDCYHTVLQIK